MPPQELRFSVNQFLVKDITSFDPSLFDVMKSEDAEKVQIDGETIEITRFEKKVENSKYVTFHIEKGSRFPYSEKVFAADDLTETSNPRTPNELELNDQLFILIDTEMQRIYLSNQKSKNQMEKWFTAKLKKEVTIKPLLEEGEFMKQIESVSRISLTAESSTITSNAEATLAQVLSKDAYGFGAETAILTFTYKPSGLSDRIRGKINELLTNKKEYRKMTVVGKTASGLEKTFNTDEIMYKIPIHPSRDDKTGKFMSEEVFTTLIVKIIKQEHVEKLEVQ